MYIQPGTPYYANEALAKLYRNGRIEDVYFNFVYQPYREVDDSISGITVIAYECTNEVIAKQKIAESEKQLHLITDAMPVLVAYIDKDRKYRFNNKTYETWFGLHIRRDLREGAWRKCWAKRLITN